VQTGLGGGPVGLEATLPVRPRNRAAGHVRNRQRFVGDQVIPADQPARGLMGVVQTLTAHLGVEGGNPAPSLTMPSAAALLAGQIALGLSELGGHGRHVAGVVDVLAVGGRQEAGHAHVDPDRLAGRRQRVAGHPITGQDQIPAVPRPLDGERLDPPGDCPVLVDPHMPDPLQVHPRLRTLGRGIPATAVTIGRPGHRVEPPAALEPRVAGCLSSFDAAEERPHRLVQAAQGGLLGGERPATLATRVVPADVLELGRLVAVADAHCTHPVGGPAMLQRAVVELPVVLQTRRQAHGLLGGWPQQVLERPIHSRSCSGGVCCAWMTFSRSATATIRPGLRQLEHQDSLSDPIRSVFNACVTTQRRCRCPRFPRQPEHPTASGDS
jgi:hypothetical protein